MEYTGHVFIRHGTVYTTNSNSLPNILPHPISRDWLPADTEALHLAVDAYPHIAFIPVSPRYEGPLFGRLKDVYIVSQENVWRLDSDLILKWERLERALLSLSHILLNGHISTLEFSPFPYPSTFGYKRSYSSQNRATKHAKLSRDAFVPLAALCSYAIALHPNPAESSPPAWVQLLHANGIHPLWVENFTKTQFGRFKDVERVGAVIHPACHWLKEIPTMLRADVPLWFYWADGNPQSYDRQIGAFEVQKFCPSAAQISDALQASQYSAPLSEPIQPEKNSRQRVDENIDAYFARKAEQMQKVIETETPMAREARLSREKHSKKSACPGRKGAMVFEWVDRDDNGILIRTAMTRGQVDNIWEIYGRNQRRYNSVDNEWDLCVQFGEPSSDSEDEDEDFYGMSLSQNSTIKDNTITTPLLPTSQEDWQQELESTYGDHRTPGFHMVSPNPIEDQLFFRYGFSISIGYASREPGTDHTFNDAVLIFGHRECFLNDTSKRSAVTEFFESLCKTPPFVHPELCDLSPNHDSHLGQFMSRFQGKVELKVVGDDTYYLVEPTQDSVHNVQWYVVVQDPCTALQCLRESWASSRIALAKALVRHGIPFSTRSPAPILLRSKTRYVFEGLGTRRKDYTPNKYDYYEYELRLKELVKQPRVARAALLKGGIVWRLVMEVLGDSAEGFIIDGPSDSAYHSANFLRLEPSGVPLWDDYLSHEELDFICGLYHIYTGKYRGAIRYIYDIL